MPDSTAAGTTAAANAPAAPAAPAGDALDLGLASADAMLNMTDDQLGDALGLSAEPEPEAVEGDGEPAPDAILEPADPSERINPVADQPDPEPEPETPATPEKPVKPTAEKPAAAAAAAAPAVAAAERQLETEFKVFDNQGELAIPDIAITFDANGKTRENVPLDRVVRMAQRGVFNAEREEEVVQARQVVAQSQQTIAELQQQLQATVAEYDGWFQRALTDPAFIDAARDEHARRNSPEAIAHRERQQVEQERAQLAVEREQNTIRYFTQSALVPRFASLVEKHPLVSFDEINGVFSRLIAPLLVRGQVPSARLPMVQQIIDNDLAHHVASLQEARESDKAKDNHRVEAAKTATTLAKRQLVRAAQPTASTPAKPKPKPQAARDDESADQWFERTLGRR